MILALRIVRLGAQRIRGEGIRLGTVRRPPRGVAKKDVAARNFYDVWLPALAPSALLLKDFRNDLDADAWKSFARRFTLEMRNGDPARLLDVLAALSHTTNVSIGCYCVDEAHCHRGILRILLARRGADIR